jgi:hypothetical protein
VGRFRGRSCSNERLCWFLKKISRVATIIIEIRTISKRLDSF